MSQPKKIVEHGHLESDGYFWNLKKCDRAACVYNIIMGGRGIGKTFGCLHRARTMYSKFIYVRRTEVEIGAIANPKYNPFKKLNAHFDWNIQATYTAKEGMGAFYDTRIDEDGQEIEEFVGYAAAVSTFSKLRGADLSDVDIGVYDEFMKSKNAKPIKGEAEMFFDMCETINRNRELLGEKPVIWYILSNSRSLDSPLLSELKLIPVIEHMKRNNRQAYTDKSRELHIELPADLEISNDKRGTSLYKLLGDNTYTSHAIDNEFAYDSFENIKTVNMREYEPYIQIEDLYVYSHKSDIRYHICTSQAKCPYVFAGDGIPLFRKSLGLRLHRLMMAGSVTYSSFKTKSQAWGYFTGTK